MCVQQSTSYAHYNRRRRLLIVTAVVFAVLFISIVVIAVLAFKENGCMGELQCLPISQCKGNINPDFNYECGSHDSAKRCCIPKTNTTESENEVEGNLETASRIAKMDLLPTICGIGGLADKIANSMNATFGQFPWMAVLEYNSTENPFIQTHCGGTIINNRYILTAAHCANIEKLNLIQVKLGEHNLETPKDCIEYVDEEPYCTDDPVTFPVEKIIMHAKFNRTTLKNDIALLRLAHNITAYTEYIKPICLPFEEKINETFLHTMNFTISGWGYRNASSTAGSSVLQYTTISAWNTNKCNAALRIPHGPITDSQVCAAGPKGPKSTDDYSEACSGDSGGPMTYIQPKGIDLRTNQIGIVSFKSAATCGNVNVPTIFTRVDRYLDWILDHIEP